ncbi:hypothetical protein FEDK69T_19520 [Flavobacterium enshiense DK69]|nr:hypothetical protein [Flavobacterium enshiense]ESU22693.1 hypothetical protein FEDK69T_19520 [Flavobacterium enshiense DK69]
MSENTSKGTLHLTQNESSNTNISSPEKVNHSNLYLLTIPK